MLVDLASCVFSRLCRVPSTNYVYAKCVFFLLESAHLLCRGFHTPAKSRWKKEWILDIGTIIHESPNYSISSVVILISPVHGQILLVVAL